MKDKQKGRIHVSLQNDWGYGTKFYLFGAIFGKPFIPVNDWKFEIHLWLLNFGVHIYLR